MDIYQIIKLIFVKLGSDTFKNAIDNLIRLSGLFGIIFGVIAGYILLLREFKFSIIKKVIEDDHKNRVELSNKLIQYKSELLLAAFEVDEDLKVLSDEFLEENIKKWKELFDFSQSMNSEIANIVHLMYQSQLIIKKTIKSNERSRINFKNDYYAYYINTVEWLLSICQKARLFPTLWQTIKPYRKQILFSKELIKISSKDRLKTDNIVDIGVNVSGVKREILAYCNGLIKIRNPILSYSIKDFIDLSRYIPRLMYLNNIFYLSSFKIKYEDFSTIEYILFRFEIVHELIKDIDMLKLYFLPRTRFLKVNSKVFYSKLLKSNNNSCYKIKDENTNIVYNIKNDYINFTELYDLNMIVIQIPYVEAKMSIKDRLVIKFNYLSKK